MGCYEDLLNNSRSPPDLGESLLWQTYTDAANLNQFPVSPASTYLPKLDEHVWRSIRLTENDGDAGAIYLEVYLAWSIVLAAHNQNDVVLFGAPSTRTPGSLAPLLVRRRGDSTVSEALKIVEDQLESASRLAACTGNFAANDDWFRTAIVVNDAKTMRSNKVPTAVVLEIVTVADCFVVHARFDGKLLTANRMEWIISQLCHVIQQIRLSRSASIDDIDLLAPEDISRLKKWGASLPNRVEACIHDLIEKQVAARPESQAVCAWDGTLTYRQLNKLASTLASHLRDLGIKTGSFVPVFMNKSRWTAIAILGVLKAGAAFVLLDSAHPMERLQEISRAVSATVVVASSSLASRAGALADRTVLLGESQIDWLEALKYKSPTPIQVHPDDPAYAVFTSGSTGKPKGVVIHHSAYTTSALSHGKALGLSQSSRLFQFASYAFDSSVADHLTLLLMGGCICIPSPERSRVNPADEYNTLHANTLSITPSLARTWDPLDFHIVDSLLLGGEAPRSTDLALWSPHTRVRNVYGPAECTPASTVMSILRSPEDIGLIGAPTGAVCWIVNSDDSDQLTPLGLVGELLIEGPIVGQGYLNEPIKTAAAYIECPRWLPQLREVSSRFYLTGDLVQYVADGSIRYVGRKDDQVKLRGQRIELSEVESHVCTAFSGAQVTAEVVKPQHRDCEPFLAAFIKISKPSGGGDDLFLLPEPAWGSQVSMVKDSLAQRAPSYMIPTVFIPLSHMPLNPSGKTDRRRLREAAAMLTRDALHGYSGNSKSRETRPPSTDTEKTLQEVWAKVLNIEMEDIGLEDNFFRLGGDSLTAMQVAGLLKRRDIYVSGMCLLRQMTLGELAECIAPSAHPKTTAFDSIQEGVDHNLHSPFALAPGQRLILDTTEVNINYLAETFLLSVKNRIQAGDVLYATQALVENHAMLRARFHHDGISWAQEIQDPSPELYRFREHDASSLDEFRDIAAESQRALDIERGPLLVIDLVNWNNRQYLILVGHQLVADLFSWRILWEDLEALLQSKDLCGPTLSFRRWCELQSHYARDHLPPLVALPFQCPASMHEYWGSVGWNTSITSHKVRICIEGNTSERLLAAPDPADIVQASLLHSFVQIFSDRHAPTIFCGGHGREPWDDATYLDTSRTVGWFTTFSPTYVAIGPEDGIGEAIVRTSQSRRRLPYNGWAYFASRYLHPEGRREFAHHTPFEVMFNYLGRYQLQLERPDGLFQQTEHSEDILAGSAPNRQRFALINVTVSVERGHLQIDVVWNEQMRYQQELREWWMELERSLVLAAEYLSSNSLKEY